MASISASTKHKMTIPSTTTKKIASKAKAGVGGVKKAAAGRRSIAPALKPSALATPDAIAALKALSSEERIVRVMDLTRMAMGEQPTLVDKSKPHAASTTRDRSMAAADVAIAAKELGVSFVLKKCTVMDEMQRMLFPDGISKTFADADTATGGLKPSASAVSLTSLDFDDTATYTTMSTAGTDSKRGKSTPATAREGSLLIIRALCELVGKKAEPFVVGAFLAAALDECGSNTGSVREAAEDTATALITLANPFAFPRLIEPLLIKAMKSPEWRVKANAMDRLAQSASTSPKQVCSMLPTLIPAVTNQVWDTKAQVTKAAGTTLLAICRTNPNPDIAPAIPAVVSAVCKPSETNKAVEELMMTTFVVTVDAPSLSILCPVLARALKEKLAIHKRSACIVINNMSKLVGSPEDVAPFGPLLVPELKKVAQSVQFEEIRDEALKALKSLTKALGTAYSAAAEEDKADDTAAKMAEEQAKVEAEQKRIEAERLAEEKKEEEIRLREEEEKKRFKEAMNAQRELDRLQAEKEQQEKAEEKKQKEAAKLSTKGDNGKCQGCGLKKCKKTCHFSSG